MGTWFDTLPPELVDAAGGDADRYGLWIRLTRMHLDTLPGGQGVITDVETGPWQERYESGWSPRQAAFAVWNSAPNHQRLETAPALPAAERWPAAGTELR
ncbi:MAG: hypothetical protein ACR2MN_13585 [Acidimicrobiales bacterium]